MTDPAEHPERKIIVDEDWKSQVAREREQLKDAGREQEEPTTPDSSATRSARGPLPPASFDLLISTLATQTLANLGQIPDPLEHKAIVNLELAKHYIDLLAMLQEKTKGNLSSDEAAGLDGVLHQLRMVYLAVEKQGA